MIETATSARPDRLRQSGRPLRVLDITDAWSDEVSGGVRTYLQAKARALAGMDVEHVVIVPGERDDVESLGATRLHRVAGPRVPVSPDYRMILRPGAVRDILRSERPDVVEVGSPFIVPWLVRRAMGTDGVPTVGFYHTDVVRTVAEPYATGRLLEPVRMAARAAARRLVRRVYRRFDVTVAASDVVARELRDLGVRRVRTIGLGTDLDTFRPLPAAERLDPATWGVEPGVPVAVFAGRFCAEKRLDVLLEGHARVPLARRPHLLLAGGGPLLEEFRGRTASRPRVTLLAYVRDRKEMARLYASCDMYVAPGPGETFGLSIAEAMACGLPVVAVDRGAAPERVAGSGVAELYRHENPQSCARALESMAARLDPALRDRARRHAEETFDWRRTFREPVALYRELVPVASG
ncbi:MAG: glycosyltransferase [Gemmatimonadetes bacterium]|nr:glycosyltransferase [Gemmatimonadota bacterium]